MKEFNPNIIDTLEDYPGLATSGICEYLANTNRISEVNAIDKSK